MSNRLTLIAAIIGAALLPQAAVLAGDAGGKSYRWVDSKGVVHYGDSVPPEYASQGGSEINQQGVQLRQTPRQLSPAEAAVAQQAAAEVARRRQHDDFLLSTYTQVRDIEQLRDERVALIDGQLEITRGSISSNTQRLLTLQERMLKYLPYSTVANARRLPDQLIEEVVRTLKERRGLQEGMNSRESEKNELKASFDADIARYRELTGRTTSR